MPKTAWSGLNGSIAIEAIHQPNFGVAPNARNGDAEMSSVAFAPTSAQVAPPSVERKMVSTGYQRSLVATMTVSGCSGSTARPA